MNVRVASAVVFALSCLVAPAAHAQGQFGNVGLTMFADPNFGGRSASLRVDTPDFAAIGMNDLVSSVRSAPGERWELCEHANYQGRCVIVTGADPDLGRRGLDKAISSARRVSGGRGQQPPGQSSGNGLQLFSREGFRGQSRSFTDAEADLRTVEFNDLARSVRVAPGETWEICVNANFVDCRVVNSDWPNLGGMGFAGRVSSVRPVREGAGGGGGTAVQRPGAVERGLRLFAQEGFTGESRHFTTAEEDLRRVDFNDAAHSVRVGPGETWEICVNAGFVDCRTLNSDSRSLGGFSGRVSSVRPQGQGATGGGIEGQPYLVLYEERGYRGRSQRVDAAARTLPGFMNLTGSVQVFGGTWELCEQTDFGGRCAVVTGSVPDLRALGLQNPVASARRMPSRR